MTKTKASDQYPIHDFCLTSTDMSESDFQGLKISIADTEQSVSIKRYKHSAWPVALIIDGRHRLSACLDLGLEPWIEDFAVGIDLTDQEIRDVIVSWNDKRRHETPAQRTESALRLAGNARKQGRSKSASDAELPKTTKQIAAAAGVSPRVVEQVKEVHRKAAKPIKEAMSRGEIDAGPAAKLSKLPKSQQEKIAAKGAEAIKKAAKELSKPQPRPEAPPLGAAAYLSHPPYAPEPAPERRDMAGHKTSGGIRSFVQSYLSAEQMKDFETLLADEEANFRNRVLAEIVTLGEANKAKWNMPPPPAPRIILDAVNAAIRGMK